MCAKLKKQIRGNMNKFVTFASDNTKENISPSNNLKIDMIYKKSISSGLNGNSGYLHIQKLNNILYIADTEGKLSGVDPINGEIL